MTVTIISVVTLAWDCAWWVPKVDQLRPLLCRPRVETRLKVTEDPLSEVKDQGKHYQVLDLSWDEKDQLHQRERKVHWKPVIE